ncbi:hypothetical protein D3C77_290070 [compost metagenome]
MTEPGAVYTDAVATHRAVCTQAAIIGAVVARAVRAHRADPDIAVGPITEMQQVAAAVYQRNCVGQFLAARACAVAALVDHPQPAIGIARGVLILVLHAGRYKLAIMQRVDQQRRGGLFVVQVSPDLRT